MVCYITMQKAKFIPLIWLLFWIASLVMIIIYMWGDKVKECYPKENTCWVGTWLDDFQCNDKYFEKQYFCTVKEFNSLTKQLNSLTNQLSGVETKMDMQEKNLVEFRKEKYRIHGSKEKAFRSE